MKTTTSSGAEYQRIATEAARSKRGITSEMEALRDVLATKERGDHVLDSLAAKGGAPSNT